MTYDEIGAMYCEGEGGLGYRREPYSFACFTIGGNICCQNTNTKSLEHIEYLSDIFSEMDYISVGMGLMGRFGLRFRDECNVINGVVVPKGDRYNDREEQWCAQKNGVISTRDLNYTQIMSAVRQGCLFYLKEDAELHCKAMGWVS